MGYCFRRSLLIIIFTIFFSSNSLQLASATRPLHGRHELKSQASSLQSLMAGPVPPSGSSPCSHIPGTAICVDQVNDAAPFAHPRPPYPATIIDSAAASLTAETEKQHPISGPPIEPPNGEKPLPGTRPHTPFSKPTAGEKPSPENMPPNGTGNLLQGEKSLPEHQPPVKGKKPPHIGHNPSHPPAESTQASPPQKLKPPSIPMKKPPTPIEKPPPLKQPFPTQMSPGKPPSPTHSN